MAKKSGLGIIAVVVLAIAAYFGVDLTQQNSNQHSSSKPSTQHDSYASSRFQSQEQGITLIAHAFSEQKSNVQVQASGRVKAVLRDDNKGSRHQKFILELSNGQTLLIAHNIDLSPRIKNIKKGDQVEFFGEYEYSAEGGVVHWTHHDPQKQHVGGWLKHQGQTYQ